MQPTQRQMNEVNRQEYGGSQHMGPNAAGIYGTARRPADDGDPVLLNPSILTDPPAPYMPNAEQYDIYRRHNSMLHDFGITRDEIAGSNYWDSIRRTDTYKKPYVPPPPLKQGAQKRGKR